MTHAEGERTYRFMVFSNPMSGNEQRYLDWYRGQHIHDLLRIDGVVAAQMFRLADVQYGPNPLSQRYLLIWEIRTSDLASVFDAMKENLRTGLTVGSDAFDWDSVMSVTVEPVSRRITDDLVAGKSVGEVRGLAGTME
jgi:hypothetical protein